jgi:hypothetical protein
MRYFSNLPLSKLDDFSIYPYADYTCLRHQRYKNVFYTYLPVWSWIHAEQSTQRTSKESRAQCLSSKVRLKMKILQASLEF